MKHEPPADDICAVAEFRAALRRFMRETDRLAASQGLTPRRYELLVMIEGASDGSRTATMTDLTERLCLTPQSVSELVARAEEAGLVHRARDTRDGRVSRISLTPAGKRSIVAVVDALRPERVRLARLLGTAYSQARAL